MSSRPLVNTAYLILVGEVLVAAIIVFTVFVPSVKNIQADRLALSETNAELAERTRFLESIDRKRVALDQNQTDEQLLAVALPVDDDIDTVTRLLYQAAQTSGATINTILNNSSQIERTETTRQVQGEGSSVPAQIQPLGVEIKLSSNYQQLRVFLEEIEKSARLMDVTSLAIKSLENQPDALEADLDIHFYKYAHE